MTGSDVNEHVLIGSIDEVADRLWELLIGNVRAAHPVFSLNISPMRCAGVPKPPEENVIVSGLLLMSVTSSDTE